MENEANGMFPIETFMLSVKPDELSSVAESVGESVVKITMAALDLSSSESLKPTVVKIVTRAVADEDEEDEEDEDDEDPTSEETAIVCTLSPKFCLQQKLDLYLTPNESVFFTVEGPHKVSITGNVVTHPFDDENSDDDDDDFDPADYLDREEYDLSPDEDELDLSSGRIEEIVEETKSTKKESKSNKRAAEDGDSIKNSKDEKVKKQKKIEEKKVAFSKELEQGPTPSKEKVEKSTLKKLAGGITIEDKKVGSGPVAKKGNKVSVRYIGKLQNGKTFDSNTSGKPFQFKLGAGQVIKGWDLGIAGMSVKGERRIVIPAPMAYGTQALPGIPANSTLIFDVKMVSIK
ncbi:uncharacterized protein SAPINGB_P001755 [Magnusiomyces paraingens]|uniref:peptidylprolyl isomerase n=1 Tax=Magnusiomyces paraingens TaxID=2606893 RepID=A0A5E8BI29_9ASCO|nr:uncharacterized protein SAPINGB_P001755 [Saprochaete ingens]VVT48389.1 unnamed protein product [Saprochaete ingens]